MEDVMIRLMMEQLGESSPDPYLSGLSLDHSGDPIAALVSLDSDEEEETAENAAAIVSNNNTEEETAENEANGRLSASDATSEL